MPCWPSLRADSGNDWSSVRGLGAYIKGTNGHSQGIIPFLKVANDTAVAVNQGSKRKGAVCAYLETWHIDMEEFLTLRKNTGDDRRRTHDMNTACWIPDLFMERVAAGETWTLFSPDEVPDLHELTGMAFRERYLHYEHLASQNQLRLHRQVPATTLWRNMLTMLHETGHPWLTFKDACNLRSPQQHVGVVHSSNLCTEITLNTTPDEVAVCNLGSVNLVRHLQHGDIDHAKLGRTVEVAMRMLDNVIDLTIYTIDKARRSNMRHRPVGLGLMGYQDALHELGIPVASPAAVDFADRSMELISWHAIQASARLAKERGTYETYAGSLWDQGILPIDSIEILDRARHRSLDMDTRRRLDWDETRALVQRYGMRNSNCMAIAPTATIANICGVSPSIEPCFGNLYVKANMSGAFTILNPYLVAELKDLGLWDAVMVQDLKRHDGSVQDIERVPAELKDLFATAFEIDAKWLVEAASRRQKWIDQSQSLNIYFTALDGARLSDLYQTAWRKGLKTTYYLRTLAKSAVEKSTLIQSDGKLNAVPVTPVPVAAPAPLPLADVTPVTSAGAACNLLDEDCEACQ